MRQIDRLFKLLSLAFFFLSTPSSVFGQSSTITNLTNDTSPATTDEYIVQKSGETRAKKQSAAIIKRIFSSTTLPATCSIGDTFWDTDADTNGSFYVCRATDTWKDVSDDNPDSDSEVPNAITIDGGTIGTNTITGINKTSGLLDEGGQASLGSLPHYLGIADGSVASPVSDPQPVAVFQRTSNATSSSIDVQVTHIQTGGTGFHYPLHSWVENIAPQISDMAAVSGSTYANPTGIVVNVIATPSGSGGTLASATYGYYVTAIIGGTETVGSDHVDAVVTGPTGSVALSWDAVASATAYRVYRYIPADSTVAPAYQQTASTSLTDTGAAGTGGVGLSQTLWSVWGRSEKVKDSARLAGAEFDIINNSGRDPGPRIDRAGSTIGIQIVSAGDADNSVAMDFTGENDSQFHKILNIRSNSFDQVGIDFSESDATKPALLLANSQTIQSMAGSTPVNLLFLNSSFYLEFGRPQAAAVAGLTLANGANNDLAIGTALEHIAISGPTAAFTVTGMASGVKGRKIVLYNTTTQAMTIANESASSTAANRILTKTGADLVLPARSSLVRLFYNTGQSRWIVETEDLVTTGGGGSGVTLREVDGSPSLTATTIELDQTVGLSVTDQGSGVGRISYTHTPSALPRVKLRHSASQSITSQASPSTVLTWDTEVIDQGGWHSAVDDTLMNVPETGTYAIDLSLAWRGGNGTRGLQITLNGTVVKECDLDSPGAGAAVIIYPCSGIVEAVTDDDIKIQVWQDHGSALAIDSSTLSYVFVAKMR